LSENKKQVPGVNVSGDFKGFLDWEKMNPVRLETNLLERNAELKI